MGAARLSIAGMMTIVCVFAPLWYGLACLIAGPLPSLAGGALFLRRIT
jgi:hypothetical protein